MSRRGPQRTAKDAVYAGRANKGYDIDEVNDNPPHPPRRVHNEGARLAIDGTADDPMIVNPQPPPLGEGGEEDALLCESSPMQVAPPAAAAAATSSSLSSSAAATANAPTKPSTTHRITHPQPKTMEPSPAQRSSSINLLSHTDNNTYPAAASSGGGRGICDYLSGETLDFTGLTGPPPDPTTPEEREAFQAYWSDGNEANRILWDRLSPHQQQQLRMKNQQQQQDLQQHLQQVNHQHFQPQQQQQHHYHQEVFQISTNMDNSGFMTAAATLALESGSDNDYYQAKDAPSEADTVAPPQPLTSADYDDSMMIDEEAKPNEVTPELSSSSNTIVEEQEQVALAAALATKTPMDGTMILPPNQSAPNATSRPQLLLYTKLRRTDPSLYCEKSNAPIYDGSNEELLKMHGYNSDSKRSSYSTDKDASGVEQLHSELCDQIQSTLLKCTKLSYNKPPTMCQGGTEKKPCPNPATTLVLPEEPGNPGEYGKTHCFDCGPNTFPLLNWAKKASACDCGDEAFAWYKDCKVCVCYCKCIDCGNLPEEGCLHDDSKRCKGCRNNYRAQLRNSSANCRRCGSSFDDVQRWKGGSSAGGLCTTCCKSCAFKVDGEFVCDKLASLGADGSRMSTFCEDHHQEVMAEKIKTRNAAHYQRKKAGIRLNAKRFTEEDDDALRFAIATTTPIKKGGGRLSVWHEGLVSIYNAGHGGETRNEVKKLHDRAINNKKFKDNQGIWDSLWKNGNDLKAWDELDNKQQRYAEKKGFNESSWMTAGK
ncbi:hypothetical protein ACHAWC_007861 [Mediolabrus comicus]